MAGRGGVREHPYGRCMPGAAPPGLVLGAPPLERSWSATFPGEQLPAALRFCGGVEFERASIPRVSGW